MKWLLLEEFIPSDDKFVLDAIHGVGDNDKYTPTTKFLKSAYVKLNDMFFDGRLPNDIEFKVDRDTKDNASGRTNADDNDSGNGIDINYVSLNGTLMKSPHSWIETIVHEMIHIEELVTIPERFIGKKYDMHGEWFLDRAKEFSKVGLNIGEKDMDYNIVTSVDDEDIKKKHSSELYLKIGYNPVTKLWQLLKIKAKDKDYALSYLKKEKYRLATIVKTDNLNAVRLSICDIDSFNGPTVFNMTDSFVKRYGPFEDVETIDLSKVPLVESSPIKRKLGQWRDIVITVGTDGRKHYQT